MSQPEWECVAQLGDCQPLVYGGAFLLVDQTGVYSPEIEYVLERDKKQKHYDVYRILCEKCTFIDGILSDNKFHPAHKAWFAKGLDGDTIDRLCSDNPIDRAWGYDTLVSIHGHFEFDQYPIQFGILQAYSRYRATRFQVSK